MRDREMRMEVAKHAHEDKGKQIDAVVALFTDTLELEINSTAVWTDGRMIDGRLALL